MKRSILFFVVFIALFSCRKENNVLFQNEGVITGYDQRLCPCTVDCPCVCGGLYFHFVDTSYTSNIPLDNPGIFAFGANPKFPVYVYVNWQNTTRCGVTAIKILEYRFK